MGQGFNNEIGPPNKSIQNRGLSANTGARPARGGYQAMVPINHQKLHKVARPYIMSAKAGTNKVRYNNKSSLY